MKPIDRRAATRSLKIKDNTLVLVAASKPYRFFLTVFRSMGGSRATALFVSGLIALGAAGIYELGPTLSEHPPQPRSTAPLDLEATQREPSSPASALFRGAMQAARDASMEEALAQMDEAIALEPTYAAAHLRRALFSYNMDASVREHFAKATPLRAALTRRERLLLNALEPCARLEPEPKVAVERLERALAAEPNDPELQYFLGIANWFAGDLDRSIREVDAAAEKDASFVEALRFGAYLRTLKGDPSAVDLYERCIGRSPAATSCLRGLATLTMHEGRCAETEGLTRRILAIEPNSVRAYATLSQSLNALGSPEEAVHDVLEREIVLIPLAEREAARQELRTKNAILHGEFDNALAATRAWQAALAREAEEWEQLAPVDFAIDVLVETNRRDEAARAASTFLRSRGGWMREMGNDAADAVLAASLYRAGALTRTELDLRRKKWLARERSSPPRLGEVHMQNAWMYAYGISVVTREDAVEAIAARPTLPEPPPNSRDPLYFDAFVGLAYARAAMPQEALPFLERASKVCSAFEQPIVHTWVLAALGDVEVATGAVEEGCHHYEKVTERWDRAKSRTAAKAYEASRACGCEVPPAVR